MKRLLFLYFLIFPTSIMWAQAGNVQLKNEYENLDLYMPEPFQTESEGEMILPPATIVESESGDDLIIKQLKGLHFISNKDALEQSLPTKEGVFIENIPELESLRAKLETYIGQAITLNDLNRLTQKIVLHMRKANRPVVDAIIPEQNISDGIVKVLVLVGKRGEIRTENNTHFSDDTLLRYIRLNQGEPIDGKMLVNDLEWINQNPFRQVDLVYTEGKNFGETDIILRTNDRLPYRIYGGYENNGTALTGMDRYHLGINWGNVLGLDHLFNYQYTRSKDSKRMQAHTFSYFVPLPWRHKLWAFGSYSNSEPTLPSPLKLKAESWRISSRYIAPLPLLEKLEHELTIGFDFIDSDSDLFFTSTQINDSPTQVAQAVLAYSGRRADKYGFTEFSLSGFLSPGDLTDNNSNQDFSRSRNAATADYIYARAEVERVTKLPYQFLWSAKFGAQLAGSNLLSSEQMSLGGASSIRGYETNEITTDNAFTMTHELQSPLLHPLSDWFSLSIQNSLSLLFFWDYATAYNHTLQAGEDAHIILSSIGPALRFKVGGYLTLNLDWGFQLRDSGNSPTGDNNRLEVSATVSY